jgi:GNAT superfamily N-acetyltransferase
MLYQLREVDGADEEIADEIKELHELTFWKEAPPVNPEGGYWWLAYALDGARDIAGFCGLTWSTLAPETGYLKRAGVLAEHRGAGLQRRFVKVREAKARRLGMRWVVTDTTDNIPSANNLIKCGYLLFKPEVPWGPSGATLYWRKTL